MYISAMPAVRRERQTFEMLIEKACSFEGTSYKGLFNFVRYIEQLKKKYDVDYGEANIIDEQADTVRIMTIHKSKRFGISNCICCCRNGQTFQHAGRKRKYDHSSGAWCRNRSD